MKERDEEPLFFVFFNMPQTQPGRATRGGLDQLFFALNTEIHHLFTVSHFTLASSDICNTCVFRPIFKRSNPHLESSGCLSSAHLPNSVFPVRSESSQCDSYIPPAVVLKSWTKHNGY